MTADRPFHEAEINGLTRKLPLFPVAPDVQIAVFNLLGDTEVVEAAARGLSERISAASFDALVTAETKSVPLVYELARQMSKPWVVLRKAYKAYMGEVVSAETHSITTGAVQTLYLDEKDRHLVERRAVLVVDDVVSTGSTVEGMLDVLAKVNANVVGIAAVFTEGDVPNPDVIALGHLPLFRI